MFPVRWLMDFCYGKVEPALAGQVCLVHRQVRARLSFGQRCGQAGQQKGCERAQKCHANSSCALASALLRLAAP